MNTPDPRSHPVEPQGSWSERWRHLARTVSLAPAQPVLLALSGGADSTYLLHVLAAARERPPVLAVHVDHGLRGAESARDAAFCARLCRSLGVPLVVRRAALEPEGPSLEARARTARYRVLAQEARRHKSTTLVTGHHADDILETLLMRWIRGTSLTGLAALKPRLELCIEGLELRVVRPLFGLRREEVRELLASAELSWCEDSSNRSVRYARNRVRHVLIPGIERAAGSGGVENLRAFGRAVEELEAHLARATADLSWAPSRAAPACRSVEQAALGGTLPRILLMRLPYALRRRALWRLVLEGTGRAPGRASLEGILGDLGRGRCTRHALPGDYGLQLRAATLELLPPARVLDAAVAAARSQPCLPFPPPLGAGSARFLPFGVQRAAPLDARGSVTLPDGRQLTAERIRGEARRDVPRGRTEVELDGALAERRLTVRWARPGDRFHPLGAPGSRPLRRVLADWGVPRDERQRVPLVLAGDEIVWVAGVRPGESARVRPPAAERLRLRLLRAAPEGAQADGEELGRPVPERVLARGQQSFWDSAGR